MGKVCIGVWRGRGWVLGVFRVRLSERLARDVVVFDLDGVVVDSSARGGAAEGESGGVRSVFWRVLLDPRRVHMDEVNDAAVEALAARRSAGFYVAVVTGRPASMADATIEWLRSRGILQLVDEIVFRTGFDRDDAYKARVVGELYGMVTEVHEDSERVCNRLLREGLAKRCVLYRRGRPAELLEA